jgi:hypothetical protein
VKERTPEMLVAAQVRRLRRYGVRQVDFADVGDGTVQALAKIQEGRAHRTVTSRPAAEVVDALADLADKVRPERPMPERPKARRVSRPAVPVVVQGDQRPLGEQLAELEKDRIRREQRRAVEREDRQQRRANRKLDRIRRRQGR